MKRNADNYFTPESGVFEVLMETLLCDSPEGGLEDIGYDDWVTTQN